MIGVFGINDGLGVFVAFCFFIPRGILGFRGRLLIVEKLYFNELFFETVVLFKKELVHFHEFSVGVLFHLETVLLALYHVDQRLRIFLHYGGLLSFGLC
jgi:hypothetical protein